MMLIDMLKRELEIDELTSIPIIPQMGTFAKDSEDNWRHGSREKFNLLMLDNKPTHTVGATMLFETLLK